MTTVTIEELAGKHLGKTSDGTTMKKYVAPTEHDASLLVAIPRSFNRVSGNITSPFEGVDVWNAYEFSYISALTAMPKTGILKIVYMQDSDNIVESKSLKLYLNSFDFEHTNEDDVISTITNDLSKCVGHTVHVSFFPSESCEDLLLNSSAIINRRFRSIDKSNLNLKGIDYSVEDSNILSTKVSALNFSDKVMDNYFTFHTANLRSNCEITNQKDTGNCYIAMRGINYPDIKELTLYILSMRNSQHFHENVCEIIYDTLYKKFEPIELFVGCFYNRRGGIDINPIRADSLETISKFTDSYAHTQAISNRTFQQ